MISGSLGNIYVFEKLEEGPCYMNRRLYWCAPVSLTTFDSRVSLNWFDRLWFAHAHDRNIVRTDNNWLTTTNLDQIAGITPKTPLKLSN